MKASSSYTALLLCRLLLAAPPYSNPILSPIETIPSALVIGSHTPDSNLRRSGIGNYIYYRERANPLNTLRKPLSQPIIPLPLSNLPQPANQSITLPSTPLPPPHIPPPAFPSSHPTLPHLATDPLHPLISIAPLPTSPRHLTP